MTSNLERVTILLPKDVHNALVAACDHRHESMSNIGRRLFIDWLIESGYYKQPAPPKPGPKREG